MNTVHITATGITVTLDQEVIGIAELLCLTSLTSSTSESFRMIDQGAVQLNGEKVSDRAINLVKGGVMLQVGKRKYAYITIQ